MGGGEVLGGGAPSFQKQSPARAPRRNENRFGMNVAAAMMAGGGWKSFTPLSLSPGSKEKQPFPFNVTDDFRGLDGFLGGWTTSTRDE